MATGDKDFGKACHKTSISPPRGCGCAPRESSARTGGERGGGGVPQGKGKLRKLKKVPSRANHEECGKCPRKVQREDHN